MITKEFDHEVMLKILSVFKEKRNPEPEIEGLTVEQVQEYIRYMEDEKGYIETYRGDTDVMGREDDRRLIKRIAREGNDL